MLKRLVLFCVLVLLMAHVLMFEECYCSSNWRLRSIVERPYIVNGHKIGIFSIKKGNQIFTGKHKLLTMHPSGNEYNLIFCIHCSSTRHPSTHCPLQKCPRCNEFGHVSFVCKKTLIV